MEAWAYVKWSNKIYDCEETRTHNHLVCKGTFTQFDSMVECSFTMKVFVCSSTDEVSQSSDIVPVLSKVFPLTANQSQNVDSFRSSPPEVLSEKGVLKICSKFTGEHPCRSVISIKLLCNLIEIILRHGCSPVNLSHIRTSFSKNTSGRLLLFFLNVYVTC